MVAHVEVPVFFQIRICFFTHRKMVFEIFYPVYGDFFATFHFEIESVQEDDAGNFCVGWKCSAFDQFCCPEFLSVAVDFPQKLIFYDAVLQPLVHPVVQIFFHFPVLAIGTGEM